jgi:hypothetical protein
VTAAVTAVYASDDSGAADRSRSGAVAECAYPVAQTDDWMMDQTAEHT